MRRAPARQFDVRVSKDGAGWLGGRVRCGAAIRVLRDGFIG